MAKYLYILHFYQGGGPLPGNPNEGQQLADNRLMPIGCRTGGLPSTQSGNAHLPKAAF